MTLKKKETGMMDHPGSTIRMTDLTKVDHPMEITENQYVMIILASFSFQRFMLKANLVLLPGRNVRMFRKETWSFVRRAKP